MVRLFLIFTLSGLALMMGCSRGNEETNTPVATESSSVRAEAWRESQMITGQEVYEAACASCHDEADSGAPLMGNRDAWSPRSDLWAGVLTGHAESGYLGMPEKGGHGELTDAEVSAAVEYILVNTFPELPRD